MDPQIHFDGKTYRLDPNRYPARRRRIIVQWTLLFTAVTIAVLAFLNRGGLALSLEGFFSLICAAIPGLVVGGLLTWASLRHLRAQWFSYELTLADDWIRQRGDRLPDVQLQRSQIASIEEYPDTGLKLRTSDKHTYMLIPTALMEYAAVRDHVGVWGATGGKFTVAMT